MRRGLVLSFRGVGQVLLIVGLLFPRPVHGQGAIHFIRGDATVNGIVDITDPITTLGFLFLGSPEELACRDAGDSTDDGNVDISDAIWTLTFLFLGGVEIPEPGSKACGPDPKADGLDCLSFPPCNRPPQAAFSANPVRGRAPLEVSFDASLAMDPDGNESISSYSWTFGDGESGLGILTNHTYVSPGDYSVSLTVADNLGASSKAMRSIIVTEDDLPPDPSWVAPPLDLTAASSLFASTEFLYTGPQPIQSGVAPGTMEPRRAAVVRGQVRARDGTPLQGVVISIFHHVEFGQTLSRGDGMFDLAVNGGGVLSVNYAKEGFLEVQRQVEVPWQDYVFAPGVVMITPDDQVTRIDLGVNVPAQVAQGSVVIDDDGTRQATLLFPQGTEATMTLPDGTTEGLNTLHVRATEYTVGTNGPAAMPGELPPTSGYTYAVELSADEAMAAGAKIVRFSQPLALYLENFLGFPVGGLVPVGYYDRDQAAWIPSENGRVIKILDLNGGFAEVDSDGDGVSDGGAALGLTDAERRQLADLYAPGASLWRVPIAHFSRFDPNWPYGPPSGATGPGQPSPIHLHRDDPCFYGGSIIECENQTLGEVLGITGTPLRLHYQSDRVRGRKTNYSLDIPLSGSSPPPVLKRIDLEIGVAGRLFRRSFPADPNQRFTFTWDGVDGYGRLVQGARPVLVRLGYVYDAGYFKPLAFAAISPDPGNSITTNRGRAESTISQEFRDELGGWYALAQGLGGWSLSPLHAYDPAAGVLYLGDGGRRSPRNLRGVITTAASVAGDGIAASPDGSLYVTAPLNQVSRIGADGAVTVVAGTGARGFGGDGGQATKAQLSGPVGIALGPDGSLYIADRSNNRVRRVGPDSGIDTVAGNGSGSGELGDGGPATRARVGSPSAVAVAPDGSLYIGHGNSLISRVGTDGVIRTVVALHVNTNPTFYFALAPNGSLFFTNSINTTVNRLGPDGMVTKIAGTGFTGDVDQDGVPATQVGLVVSGLAVSSDGSLFIADAFSRVRRVGSDGIVTTVAGIKGERPFNGDGFPATFAHMSSGALAVGPDGSLTITDQLNRRIRRLASPLPGFGVDEIVIASEDAGQLYVFAAATGRHLRTLDAFTGSSIYHFTYDDKLLPVEVTDGAGNVTRIERDGSGNPIAIVAPGGQRTELALGPDGYLAAIANPAGNATTLTYATDGLLATLTDANGRIHRFTHDSLGRLTRDADPAGGFTALARTEASSSVTAELRTAEDRVTSYRTESLPTGDDRRTTTDPNGRRAISVGTNGRTTVTRPDGTTATLERGPDPRWGMLAPVVTLLRQTTPGGLDFKLEATRTVNLSDPSNPLSLVTAGSTVKINGRSYTSTFDATTRTLTSRTPTGRQTITRSDALSRPVEVETPGFLPIQFTYDANGRLKTLSQGSGAASRVVTFGYDASGRLAEITDPLSRKTTLEYDSAHRLARQVAADGRAMHFGHDPMAT